MASNKSKNFLRFLCLAGAALLLSFLADFGFFHKQTVNLGEETDENALSMYSVPQDVAGAVSRAKNTGLPVLGVRADGTSYKIPVVMYHYVEYVADRGDRIRILLNTPPNILDNEIKTLKEAGYTFLNATDLANILDGIKQVPDKPVILTFDDGHGDFYTGAYPILKKYNAKAVLFVISGFLNGSDFLTDQELSEVAKSGLVEIGAHTVHHLALAHLGISMARSEISDSKVQLERSLGIPVTSFAYPYGSFNLPVIQMTKEAGYRTAFSTVPGTEVGNYDRFYVNRLRPGGLTGQAFLNLLQSK